MIKELLLTGEGRWFLPVMGLLLLTLILLAVRHDLTCHTVRIYNWDGKRYRWLGRERMRRISDAYVINMRESMGEASCTTRYLLLASPRLVKGRRYDHLLLRAGANEVWLPLEERMRPEVLYAHRCRSYVMGRQENAYNQPVHDRKK